MKDIRKLILLLILITTSSFIATGCWNYREINDFSIVSSLAIDRDNESGNYIVTVETVIPKGTGEVTIESDINSAQGKTIFECVRNLVMKHGRRLYFSHIKAIVISEEIAKEGIVPILDFLVRDTEVRTDIWLLVSRDKTAMEVLEGKDKVHHTMGTHLNDAMKNQEGIPKFYPIELLHFIGDLSAEGISPVLPTTRLVTKKEERVPEVYGSAVFNKDKMVGWIDGLETRNLLIIRNELKGGVIDVLKVDDTGIDVTLEIIKCKTKVKPVFKDGELTIEIDVNIETNIGEILGTEDFISEGRRKELKKQAQETIKYQLLGTISKVQKQYKSDIFGFGHVVYKKMPNLWRTMESNWKNTFSELQVEVNVEIVIQGSGIIRKPIKMGD